MIGADLPERALTFHAVVANKGVHDGLLEPVSHVQRASHIGWWDRYAISAVAILGCEVVLRFPLGIPLRFDCRRRKRFIHDVSLPYRHRRSLFSLGA